MTNIRDWCISRQLWWGHRIPVWYCEDRRSPPAASRSSAGARPTGARTATGSGSARTRTCSTPGSPPGSGRSRSTTGRREAARDRRGPEVLLPHESPRHRARDHLLLGRADDHGGPEVRAGLHGLGRPREEHPVPRRLLHQHRARREGTQDVQVAGQLARAAGPHRDLRRRRRALHHPLPRAARTGHPVRDREERDRAELREQDLERRTVPAHEPGPGRRSGRGRGVRDARTPTSPTAGSSPASTPRSGRSRTGCGPTR